MSTETRGRFARRGPGAGERGRRTSRGGHGHGSRSRSSRRRRRSRRRRALVAWAGIFALVLAAACVAAALFAREVFEVRDDLAAARIELAKAPALLSAGDSVGLGDVARDVAERTGHAESVVSGPLWEIASAVPMVGANVAAVRDVTYAVSILANDALPPALETMSTLSGDGLALEGGGIDLAPFEEASTSLPVIGDALERAGELVSGIDRARLLDQVDETIGEFIDIVDAAAPAITQVEQSLPTILQMAGSSQPRSYLVLFQNNAEIRATGGNPSAMALVRVEDGRIELVRQDAPGTFSQAGTAGSPPVELPAELTALYEEDTASYVQNYTRSPHFPTTALLFTSLWQKTFGESVDGVISLDPVVLSYALGVMGPVTLADGSSIGEDDAVDFLLRQVYDLVEGDALAADAYFATVVQSVFARLTSGQWDPIAMYGALDRGSREGRISMWMQRPDEQQIVTEAAMAGALAPPEAQTQQIGLFLNDASHSKLEYYLDASISVTCDRAAGTVTTAMTITNNAPATGLNDYVIGQRNHVYGHERDTMLLDVLAFAPAQTPIVDVEPETGDIPDWDREGSESGHAARSVTVAVPRGQTREVGFTAQLADDRPVTLRHTPGVREIPVAIAPECS